ncbi:OpgC domain-containing protein [Acidimangrovimonas sediminis]|uniref:OpgC domain-containing protein n=1 Tax=Acidimangrovimonas sediminis TaxID=2056283 RepID=UPI000C808EA4|nr:OpgC domain-containing protein [Acidimangrovimonas sediminis]
MRLTLLDGFRGYFLLFMTVAHVNVYLDTFIGKVNHHYIGWVEDAQGFVFISGFVIGLVYTKRLLRKGAQEMGGAVRTRMVHIWRYHAGLALLFLAAALILPRLGVHADILDQQAKDPILFTLMEMGLVTGTLHMGILPMYLIFMAATPFALRAFQKGNYLTVAVVSGLAWIFAQTGLPDWAEYPVQNALADMGHPINIGIYFNVFGWQVLYMAGLWLGYLMATDKLDLGFFRTKEAETIFYVLLAGFALFAFVSVVTWSKGLGLGYSKFVWKTFDRGNLYPIYVFNFAVDLYLVVWLLNAGHDHANRVIRGAAATLNWVFTRRIFVFLGQHALQVFTTQVVVVYILSVWMQGQKPDTLEANLLFFACFPPLYLAAWVHKRAKAPRPARVTAVPAE